MDIAKLEKLKVVDLRNELQLRGLDSKGVKAVLVERLRTHLEAIENDTVDQSTPDISNNTPRRVRRTRSTTRSPSPIVQQKEPEQMEQLKEEESLNETLEDQQMDLENVQQLNDDDQRLSQQMDIEQAQIEQSFEDDAASYNDKSNETENKNIEIKEIEQNDENDETDENNSDLVKEQQCDNIEMEESEQDDFNCSNEIKQTDCEEIERKEKEDDEDDILENNEMNVEKDAEIIDKTIKNKNQLEPEEKISQEKICDDINEHVKSKHSIHSSSRSRSQSPKRHNSSSNKIADETINAEDEPTIEDKQFGLSWYDSDLHLRIDPVTFTSAKPMNHEVYSLVWSGVRANFGVRSGHVCFEVRLAEEIQLGRSHLCRDVPQVFGFRIGFSQPNPTLLLGEDENSFAYCESGRKASNMEFTDYGKPYKLDDVIGCYLDLESNPCTVRYTLNGEDQGVAFTFEKDILGEDGALFPHVVTKGYEFHVNFADNDNLLANFKPPKRMVRKSKKADVDKNSKTDNSENIEETNKKFDHQDECEKELNDDTNECIDSCKDKDESTSIENLQLQKNIDNPPPDENADCNDENSADKQISMESKDLEKTTDLEIEKKLSKSDNEEENENPTPKKRLKMDEESRTRQVSLSESEYEEVIPEPREPVELLQGYELIALIPEEEYIPGPQRPESRKDCEVILMVGLPGAGKTYWALNHIKENPKKNYHIIGVDALIAKMTIDGKPRTFPQKGHWEKVYDSCSNSLSSLEEIATKRRRNFILDQTNVYASAQRRKMKGFGDFKRIAVVCIPTEEELKRRNNEKNEKGLTSPIKESTLNSLRASFTLPSLEFGWFDDIIYTDLSDDLAKEEVKKYNEKGKSSTDSFNTSNRNRDRRYRRERYPQRNDRRRYDDRRQPDRWNDRRNFGTGGGNAVGNRWGNVNYHSGGAAGYRDDRSYGMNSNSRGYDNRNRYGSGNVTSGQQNWASNNRNNRYDNHHNRAAGRFDSYSGRDYRDRNRNTGAGTSSTVGRRDSYRSGGGNQRDFRHGHRDIREDSRGGYDRSCSQNDGHDQYPKNGKSVSGNAKPGKWGIYAQQPHQQHNPVNAPTNNWQQQNNDSQQQFWGYSEMQNFGNQQQQYQDWQQDATAQNQDWSSWWKQQNQPTQQKEQRQQQQPQHKFAENSDGNHYWSQYSYQTSVTGEKEAVTK